MNANSVVKDDLVRGVHHSRAHSVQPAVGRLTTESLHARFAVLESIDSRSHHEVDYLRRIRMIVAGFMTVVLFRKGTPQR
jgi:hypothetical protein